MAEIIISVIAVAGVSGVLILGWAIASDPTLRTIKEVEKRRIADVREGEYARLVGTVEIDAPIVAPLSGRECAFWTVVIEEKGFSDLWSTVLSEQGGVDFYVRDESGRALVRLHADHTDASLTQDARFTSGLLKEAGPQLEAFLRKHGHTSKGWLLNKPMRYREGVVTSGERVAVVGCARWEPDPDPKPTSGSYRDGRPMRLVMSCEGSKSHLLLSDVPATTE